MVGSWAGAMGHTQFIPTSFLSYAVDFDGDGRRNVWAPDAADALASTANYLGSSGWRLGQPAIVEVRLPQGFDYALAEDTRRSSAAEWQARGVRALATARCRRPTASRSCCPPAPAAPPSPPIRTSA